MIFYYKGIEVKITSLDTIKPLKKYNTVNAKEFSKVYGYINCKYTQKNIIEQLNFEGVHEKTLVCIGGGYTPINSKNTLQKDRYIFFCSGEYVCKWDIVRNNLDWYYSFDSAMCLTIQMIEDSNYILISGELELTKIDLNGEVLWQYSGSDIFVTEDGKSGAQVIDNKIYIYDWNNILHILDLEGHLLEVNKSHL